MLLVFETDLTQVWGVPQPWAGQVPDGAAVVGSAVRRLGRGALPCLRAGPPRRPLVPLAVAGGVRRRPRLVRPVRPAGAPRAREVGGGAHGGRAAGRPVLVRPALRGPAAGAV